MGRLEEAILAFQMVPYIDPEGTPDWIRTKIQELQSRVAGQGK